MIKGSTRACCATVNGGYYSAPGSANRTRLAYDGKVGVQFIIPYHQTTDCRR